jgi:mannose-6-phosphate isomerase
LRVLDFRPCSPPVLHGTEAAGWVRYDTDAAEFLLRRLAGDGETAVPDSGPRILLCTGGTAAVRGSHGEQTIGRGEALWLAAGDSGVTVLPQEPGTQLFLACDGLDG